MNSENARFIACEEGCPPAPPPPAPLGQRLRVALGCLIRGRLPRRPGTAYLLPSRTGGADHSLRADMTGLSPMVCGGPLEHGAPCEGPEVEAEPDDGVRVRTYWVEVIGDAPGETRIVLDGWIARPAGGAP